MVNRHLIPCTEHIQELSFKITKAEEHKYASVNKTIIDSDIGLLLGAKPLSVTIVAFCYLDPWEHISGTF